MEEGHFGTGIVGAVLTGGLAVEVGMLVVVEVAGGLGRLLILV